MKCLSIYGVKHSYIQQKVRGVLSTSPNSTILYKMRTNSWYFGTNHTVTCTIFFQGLRPNFCPKFSSTFIPVLSCHSKWTPKIGFHYRLSLNAGQKYCRYSKGSILQYFWPSLSYHFPLRPLFCLFLSGHLRQVLLYIPSKFYVCASRKSSG